MTNDKKIPEKPKPIPPPNRNVRSDTSDKRMPNFPDRIGKDIFKKTK